MLNLLSINKVNSLGCEDFVKIFGRIVECCPEAAIEIWRNIPFANVEAMATAASQYLDQLPANGKERVLQLHPDLGGRLAQEGKLTEESTREQISAELHNLSSEEKMKMNELNTSYRKKFGFPFVICARENKAAAIMQGLQSRLDNTKQKELQIGIDEVKKICRLRILELVQM